MTPVSKIMFTSTILSMQMDLYFRTMNIELVFKIYKYIIYIKFRRGSYIQFLD